MTFSRAERPLTRWNCWKMKPKAFRRISVRNRSGRLVISRPPRKILPEVGRAMHPRRDRRVVFPDPLGPLSTVVRPGSIAAVIPSRAQNSLGFPAWKTFRTSFSSILSMFPSEQHFTNTPTYCIPDAGDRLPHPRRGPLASSLALRYTRKSALALSPRIAPLGTPSLGCFAAMAPFGDGGIHLGMLPIVREIAEHLRPHYRIRVGRRGPPGGDD